MFKFETRARRATPQNKVDNHSKSGKGYLVKLIVPENIREITPYPPGKPQDELEREYGIRNSIKMASNEKPTGPSPQVVQALVNALDGLNRYPDGSSYYLTEAIARKYGVDQEEVVLGNGSNEVIDFLVKAFVQNGDEVITSHPSFLMYQKFVQMRGGINHIVPMKEMCHDLEAVTRLVNSRTRLIFLDNPNNPMGTVIAPVDLYVFLSTIPEHVIVVIDEAYADFMAEELRPDAVSLIRNSKDRCPVVFLRTFSKAYGLPGLRIGYGLMAGEVASCLHKVRQPFNVNSLAQVGARAALDDDESFYLALEQNRAGIIYLRDALEKLGCNSYPTQGNFILVDVQGDANTLYEAMLRKGVIIRSMAAYGLPSSIRVTIGTELENLRFIEMLEKCLGELGYEC